MKPNATQLSLMYSDTGKYVSGSKYSNGKYHDVLQHCIVTTITTVKMEELVSKMSIINTRANVSLALPEDTVKHVSSSVAL